MRRKGLSGPAAAAGSQAPAQLAAPAAMLRCAGPQQLAQQAGDAPALSCSGGEERGAAACLHGRVCPALAHPIFTSGR